MNPKVDKYLIEGCMRCKLGATPACKVNAWKNELILLRSIAQNTVLEEELKWGIPCYTFKKKNVFMLAAFNNYCSISFFKGVLLKDPHRLLVKAGENTQSARSIKFAEITEIKAVESILKTYIVEAIEIEKSGLKVQFKKSIEAFPVELQQSFNADKQFEKAFYALSLGRQRAYILHFSQAKQEKTRLSRIKKHRMNILNGIGFNDMYKAKKKQ